MRYVILVLLNLPVILLAFINIVTQFKLGKITIRRFHHQLTMWSTILIVLICSFPVYNYLSGRSILDSQDLSFFDVIEVTMIVYLIYVVNDHRRKIEQNERTIRDLHQELSIQLSSKK